MLVMLTRRELAGKIIQRIFGDRNGGKVHCPQKKRQAYDSDVQKACLGWGLIIGRTGSSLILSHA